MGASASVHNGADGTVHVPGQDDTIKMIPLIARETKQHIESQLNRSLTSVLVREYSKLQDEGLTGLNLETRFENVLRNEQHNIRSEVVMKTNEFITSKQLSPSTDFAPEYKEMCVNAIDSIRSKNAYTYLVCVDGSSAAELALKCVLNMKRKFDHVCVFHAFKEDEDGLPSEFKANSVKEKMTTILVSSILSKYYSFCWRKKQVGATLKSLLLELLQQYAIHDHAPSFLKDVNTPLFDLPSPQAPDFLILGHVGRKGLHKHEGKLTTLGTSADVSLRSIHIPCIIVKAEVPEGPKVYIYAADQSEGSKTGFDILLTLVRPRDVVKVIHVQNMIQDSQPDFDQFGADALVSLKSYYEEELSNFGPVDSTFIVLPKPDGTSVGDAIIDYVDSSNATFLAIAPRAKIDYDIGRMTTHMIMNCKCNFILCKN